MLLEINGIVNVNLSEDDFCDLFVDFIESLGGTFGGGVVTVDDKEE